MESFVARGLRDGERAAVDHVLAAAVNNGIGNVTDRAADEVKFVFTGVNIGVIGPRGGAFVDRIKLANA